MGSSRGLLGVRTRGGIPRRVEWGREGGLLQGDRATPYPWGDISPPIRDLGLGEVFPNVS